ncbi:alpha carbonic anhydrase 1, chloroplastic [Cynara cardunculus var. scolymus]|uniref:alpha carbonic anhydrase 1, chloroplastic n=1 Tax=Cynara cardunculus var. scolymus TaxID=59895 RepID=UPI000D627C53|nr:alpha carbonic anhydrase 1, chloroplastic [Cynara cardunculus var. scolymus]
MASQPLSFFTISLILFLTSCANGVNGGGPQFSYLGPSGPQKWGNLSPTYSACSNGRFQSPVNIVRSKCVSGRHLKPLDVEYSLAANATLVDNLFNVAMKFDGNVGVLRLNDKNFSFIQMHWHSPSEHQLDGVRYDAELHLVHKADDGGIAVIAVLYRYGHPDPLLTKIQSKLAQLMKVVHHSSSHEQPQVPLGTFTTKQIRKHTRKYYRYVGSFSTPPCTEGVIWNILGKVRSISREQVEALKAPLIWGCKSNSRPVQPLNGRKIEMYDI